MSHRFSDLGLSPSTLQVMEELGFTTPTPIQAESIPHLLSGRDLLGQSKTGSGKTAAFTLPMLERLNLRERYKPQALILCPTRELCAQVAREVRKLGRRHSGLQVVILSGGLPFFPQKIDLERGAHVVVGTPGRVLDHLSRETLNLREIHQVVLDEADRMLDMGFQEDMVRILENTPLKRQTILFSATFPEEIERASSRFQRDPVRVTIEATEEEKNAAPDLDSLFRVCEDSEKRESLLEFLGENPGETAIVFANLKRTVIELGEFLASHGLRASAIHGDLEQFERDRVMAKFRNLSTPILVATDVAARGIDVEALGAVVNYDFPTSEEVYVHRVGRAGRAGRKGKTLLLVNARQSNKMERLEEFLGITLKPWVPRTHTKTEAPNISEAPVVASEMLGALETIQILGGRKDKLRPGDILGALTGEAGGLKATQIGKIEIHDHHAFVAISKEVAEAAFKSLENGRIKGRKFRIKWI